MVATIIQKKLKIFLMTSYCINFEPVCLVSLMDHEMLSLKEWSGGIDLGQVREYLVQQRYSYFGVAVGSSLT